SEVAPPSVAVKGLRPVRSAVGGAIDAAEKLRIPTGGRVKNVRVLRIDDDAADAVFRHLRRPDDIPARTAVRGLHDPDSVRRGALIVIAGAYVDDAGVRRMHGHGTGANL